MYEAYCGRYNTFLKNVVSALMELADLWEIDIQNISKEQI